MAVIRLQGQVARRAGQVRILVAKGQHEVGMLVRLRAAPLREEAILVVAVVAIVEAVQARAVEAVAVVATHHAHAPADAISAYSVQPSRSSHASSTRQRLPK